MNNILRPIVECAGYQVVALGSIDPADIDVVIASDDVPEIAAGEGAEVLKLRAQPDADDGDDSIYRYDRAALLAALGRSAARRKG